jgi:hypothetical protein
VTTFINIPTYCQTERALSRASIENYPKVLEKVVSSQAGKMLRSITKARDDVALLKASHSTDYFDFSS